MNLPWITENHVFHMLKQTFDAWMEDNALRLSAALAYYSIFSIAPLLVIAVSVAGLVLGEKAVRGQLDNQLVAYIGPQASAAVQTMVQSASKPSEGWTGAILGFITLMLGASGVFGQLKDALNTIWEVKPAGGGGVFRFVRERLLNFGMVLIIGFLLLVSLLLSTALAALNGYFKEVIGIPAVVGGLLGFGVSLTVVTTLFAFIFKVLPDVRIEWRNVWTGAVVTALLFELGKWGLGFYLGRESTASSFGAAGSVVLLLLWVYYASCILLFGAEFTQVYARATGHDIQPADGAIAVTAAARAQQGLVSAEVLRPRPVLSPEPAAHVVDRAPLPNPVPALLTVTVASFLLGALARRREEERPAQRIRSGFTDLGVETAASVADLLRRTGKKLEKQMS